MIQQTLIPKQELRYIKKRTHGGMNLKKRRKTKRPLQAGCTTHIVFKSSKAHGKWCFLRNKHIVQRLLHERSRKFFVQVEDFVNMGNHLHIRVKFKDRKAFQNFLRSFAAMLARKITGASKSNKLKSKFWDGLVYTRVLISRLEELGLKGYFLANRKQKERGYIAREDYLKKFNQFIYRLRNTRASPYQQVFT